jgi:hypothetical protein
MPKLDRARTAIRLPSYEQVASDPVLYAHASRTFHLESNPGNARALVQAHGERDVWLNPPPIPLSTPEMDGVFASPFQRRPHPSYGEAKIPAFEMIRFSINIMRGCFGGCTFCSITEHEGTNHPEPLGAVDPARDRGNPRQDAGFHRHHFRSRRTNGEHVSPGVQGREDRVGVSPPVVRLPGICENLDTDHTPLVQLYRKARALPG